MWKARFQEIYFAAHPVARLLYWVMLGGMASLGQAPFGWPIVSLLGFAAGFGSLALLFDDDMPGRKGWAFGLGYFLLTLQWLVSPFLVEPERHAWMAPFALFFMAGGLAIFWALAFRLAWRLRRPSAVVLAVPLAELVRAYLFTGFAWGMPAYGLVDSGLAMAATWVGSHGLNVLFLGIAWAIAATVLRDGHDRILPAVVSVIGLCFVLFPAPAPREAPESAPIIRLVQPNAAQQDKWDPEQIPIIFERALELTRAPADDPIALTIWPETSLPDVLNYADDLTAQVVGAAGLGPVVIGANRFGGARLYNSAVLLNGQGEVAATYDKHHLVPFGEYMPFGEFFARFGYYGMAQSEGRGFSPGPGAVNMDLGPFGQVLPLICYEVVFPQDVRATRDRPDMLMQITNDAWFGTFSGPYQHLVQAQMRALEMGLPMVRSANTGVSAMIDARGRIVAQLPLNEAGFLDVRRQDPMAQTLYAWAGDAPVAVFLLLALALYIPMRPPKSLDREAST